MQPLQARQLALQLARRQAERQAYTLERASWVVKPFSRAPAGCSYGFSVPILKRRGPSWARASIQSLHQVHASVSQLFALPLASTQFGSKLIVDWPPARTWLSSERQQSHFHLVFAH